MSRTQLRIPRRSTKSFSNKSFVRDANVDRGWLVDGGRDVLGAATGWAMCQVAVFKSLPNSRRVTFPKGPVTSNLPNAPNKNVPIGSKLNVLLPNRIFADSTW
jgi:hypothetical protein